ncbi:MAG: hypothetical protein A2V99_00915 [Spirochaetes bacterium RBG_16_67_19]|nr:MAG: hypothetical protein A2V99_00915 [Spirochaetes bacterium RBG_16_67_19]
MRLRLQGVPEEDQEIDSIADNPGADLLVASQGPALQLGDLKARFLFQDLTRGVVSDERT